MQPYRSWHTIQPLWPITRTAKDFAAWCHWPSPSKHHRNWRGFKWTTGSPGLNRSHWLQTALELPSSYIHPTAWARRSGPPGVSWEQSRASLPLAPSSCSKGPPLKRVKGKGGSKCGISSMYQTGTASSESLFSVCHLNAAEQSTFV